MCAILSAKVAWAVAKDVEVATKVRTTVIMARKSRGEIGITSMGDVEVLDPAESKETGGTGGVDDAGSGDECKTHLCFEFISHALLSILYPYSFKTHKISSKLGFAGF